MYRLKKAYHPFLIAWLLVVKSCNCTPGSVLLRNQTIDALTALRLPRIVL